MKLIHYSLWIVQLHFIVVACSGESPDLKYSGISTDSAIKILKTSNQDTEIVALMDRVVSDREPGFDWFKFWTAVSEIRLLDRVQGGTRERVVGMFPLQCDQATKNAQAQVILDYPDFYKALFGEKSHCHTLLDEKLFSIYFDKITDLVLNNDRSSAGLPEILVEMLVNRDRFEGVHENIKANFDKRSQKEWKSFVELLIQNKSPQHVADFVSLYEKTYGTSSLVYLLIDKLVSDGDFFVKFVGVMGLVKSLDILLRVPVHLSKLKGISGDQWFAIGDYLVGEFLSENFVGKNKLERVKNKIVTFQNLEVFFNNIESKVGMKHLLPWSDSVFLSMEKSILSLSHPENIFDEIEMNVSIAFLRQRVLGDVSEQTLRNLKARKRFGSIYETISLSRLEIYVASDPNLSHQASLTYCELLNTHGVDSKKVTINQLNPVLLSQPGCTVVMDGYEGVSIDWTGKMMKASLSSVLFTGGANFKAPRGLYGVINGTSLQVKPDLEVEPPEKLDHGLVLPVSFGFHLVESTYLLSEGIYYIPFHYIVRKPRDGRTAVKKAQQGFAGGDIDLEAVEKLSGKPKLISVGGVGQEPVPPRKGGDGDISIINWFKFEELISSSSNGNQSQARSMIRPNLGLLSHFLDHAETEDNTSNIKIYVNSQALLDSLNEEQRLKFEKYCRSKSSQLSKCIYDVALKAALQMNEALLEAEKSYEASYILPQMAVENFELSEGKLGNVNPPGPVGDQGRIRMGTK